MEVGGEANRRCSGCWYQRSIEAIARIYPLRAIANRVSKTISTKKKKKKSRLLFYKGNREEARQE